MYSTLVVKNFTSCCKPFFKLFIIFFSCMFINFKGDWQFKYFDPSNPSAFNNDMLIFSTVLSAASIIIGTVKGIKSISSIRKRLNKKQNQQEIPLEEVSKIAKITESSEMPPENQDKTRKQLVAFADLSKSGDIKRVMAILPDGKVLEITPDENAKI